MPSLPLLSLGSSHLGSTSINNLGTHLTASGDLKRVVLSRFQKNRLLVVGGVPWLFPFPGWLSQKEGRFLASKRARYHLNDME